MNCLHVLDEPAAAGGRVRRRAGDRGRALAEVRARGGRRRAGRRRRAVRRAPPGARRPGARHVVGVRRAGLADARRGRPRGLRRRAGSAARGTRTGCGCCSTSLVAEHEAKGTLHRGDGPYVPPRPPATALRFPGKALALPGGALLVSDTAHHEPGRAWPATSPPRCGGSPRAGSRRGSRCCRRTSRSRSGTTSWWPTRASTCCSACGWPTATSDGSRAPGCRLRERAGAGAALQQPLSTPWDVAWFDGQVVVAMAGTHRLWAFDPVAGTVGVLAGTSAEGVRDGLAADAWFAQPSGLAADGDVLWVADSETSALRSVRRTDAGLEVLTAVGTGLFDFGHVDGPAGEALLQHPLGVTVLPDGSVAVSDTYNGAVRRYDPAVGEVSTLARDLREPSDAVVEVVGGEALLVVVESAAHRLVRVPLPVAAQRVDGGARRTQRPVTEPVARGARPGDRLRAADRSGARRPVGRPDAAHGQRHPDVAAGGGLGHGAGPAARAAVRRRPARGGAARERAGRGVRRARRRRRGARGGGLPPVPAGLGHPGAAGRGCGVRAWCSTCAAPDRPGDGTRGRRTVRRPLVAPRGAVGQSVSRPSYTRRSSTTAASSRTTRRRRGAKISAVIARPMTPTTTRIQPMVLMSMPDTSALTASARTSPTAMRKMLAPMPIVNLQGSSGPCWPACAP
nr:hypothetical protein [Angustibacter aerolatus]